MFQNKDRAREAGAEAEKAARKSGMRPEQARRRAHVTETRTQRQLDKWTRENVGLD